MKKTLVLGASANPDRYSYLAVQFLKKANQEIIALGMNPGEVEGIPILTGKPELKNIDTITLYLNPSRQDAYYDYLLSLKPRRIIFNPGTENYEFMQRAKQAGIHVLAACTLVMLNTGQYQR